VRRRDYYDAESRRWDILTPTPTPTLTLTLTLTLATDPDRNPTPHRNRHRDPNRDPGPDPDLARWDTDGMASDLKLARSANKKAAWGGKQAHGTKHAAVCSHFLQGRCRYGDACHFSHDATPAASGANETAATACAPRAVGAVGSVGSVGSVGAVGQKCTCSVGPTDITSYL